MVFARAGTARESEIFLSVLSAPLKASGIILNGNLLKCQGPGMKNWKLASFGYANQQPKDSRFDCTAANPAVPTHCEIFRRCVSEASFSYCLTQATGNVMRCG
jgi:hypothetical protein